MRAALAELGVDYDRLRDIEHDAALGNGGLGRLAACFMESMATLSHSPRTATAFATITACSARCIQDGWQQEYPGELAVLRQPMGSSPGPTRRTRSASAARWRPDCRQRRGQLHLAPGETVDAVAYDTPVVGWRGHYANTLRLWSAWATDPLRLDDIQSRRPYRRAGGDARAPTRSRRCCIQAMRRRPARNCGCGRSISSPPPHCRTWWAAHAPAR